MTLPLPYPSVRPIVLALLTLATASCAETKGELLARLAPAYRSKRVELARIARELPPPGSVRAPRIPASLDPPIWIEEETQNINTDVWPVELLTDPDAKRTGAAEVHDFWTYPNNLLYCVGWTGPHNPLDASVMDDAADDSPGVGRCHLTFSQPYLLAVRTLRYDLPEAVGVEAFLIDLRSGEVRAEFPMSFRNPHYKGESKVGSDGAADIFWDIMHCGLVAALERFPGAHVRVRRGCGPKGPDVRYEPLPMAPAMVEPAAPPPSMIMVEPPAHGG